MNTNIKNKANIQSLSKGISIIFQAPILAILVFLIFNFYLNKNNFLIIESISLLFGTILPILFIIGWSKIKGIDTDYTNKDTRKYPFLITSGIYFLGSIILWILSSNPLTNILMFCYGTNTLVVFIINLKWKISVHTIGITGPTTALMFFSPLGFILGLLAPPVMWSRVILEKHTPNQVLAGGILGYLLTFSQFALILNFLHINIDIILSSWLIIALIGILSISYYFLIKKSNKNLVIN